MASNESGSPARGRHSQQAVKQRIAQEEALLAEERQYAREALLAAQERGEFSIPHARRSRKGIVIVLVLLALAAAAFFGRGYIADFAHSIGVDLPFLQVQDKGASDEVGQGGAGQDGKQEAAQSSAADSSASASTDGKASSGAAGQASSASAASADSSTGKADAGSSSSSQKAAFNISQADSTAIPRTEAFGGFSINPAADAPIPSATAREAIQNAYRDIEGNGACAFVFVDLQSGRGICYNAGTELYSASSFKAPYAYYLLSNAEQGAYLSDDDRSNLEAALTESDNDAYDALHYARDTQDYYDWLSSRGVTDDPALGFYPDVSAATMTQLWLEVTQFLDAGSDEANWLKEMLGNTRVSFVRDGLDGTGAQVWNKGGWITDEDKTAVNDAGLIEVDGQRYLVVILTEQVNSGEAQTRVGTLARALFDARSALA